jgi:hypothetical protein
MTLSNTLKTKVGDVVGCIFEVECSVGGFLILKQIICTMAAKKFSRHYLDIHVIVKCK